MPAGEEAGDGLGDAGKRRLRGHRDRADAEEEQVGRLHAWKMGSHPRIGTK
jgi:hypothetical protein